MFFLLVRFDWLLQWKDGQPEMGWSDYLSYLVPLGQGRSRIFKRVF